jgi:hypothetical protein
MEVSAVRLGHHNSRLFYNISRRRYEITSNFNNFCGAVAGINTYAIEWNIFVLIFIRIFFTQSAPPNPSHDTSIEGYIRLCYATLYVLLTPLSHNRFISYYSSLDSDKCFYIIYAFDIYRRFVPFIF